MGAAAGGLCQITVDEAKQKAIRKHGGLNKIGWDALAEINQESSLRYVRKYCLEKEWRLSKPLRISLAFS